MDTTKIAIVGVGNVGSAVAFGLVNQGLCRELLLINRNKDKAIGLALDLRQSVDYMARNMRIWAGDPSDCHDADIVMFCLGGYPKTQDRTAILSESCAMVRPFVDQIMASGFKGHMVVLTNPVDCIAHYILRLSGLPASHVIGTGTALDSARLRSFLSQMSGIDSRSIIAFTMGEHGDTQFVPWSKIFIAGKPLETLVRDYPDEYLKEAGDIDYTALSEHLLEKVKKAGWKIAYYLGHTSYGVASAAIGIVRSIVRDEFTMHTCSVYLNGEYGHHDVFASVPCIISSEGVHSIIELDLKDEDRQKFDASVSAIKACIEISKKQ